MNKRFERMLTRNRGKVKAFRVNVTMIEIPSKVSSVESKRKRFCLIRPTRMDFRRVKRELAEVYHSVEFKAIFKSHARSFKSSRPMYNLIIEASLAVLYNLEVQSTNDARLLNPPQDHPNPITCKRLRNRRLNSKVVRDWFLLFNNSKETWPFRIL